MGLCFPRGKTLLVVVAQQPVQQVDRLIGDVPLILRGCEPSPRLLGVANLPLEPGFSARLLAGEEDLGHPVLGAFADLLRKGTEHFDEITMAILHSSALNYLTSMWIDHSMRGTKMPREAEAFATWTRLLNGIADPYALFSFPKGTPFQSYAYGFPDFVMWVNLGK